MLRIEQIKNDFIFCNKKTKISQNHVLKHITNKLDWYSNCYKINVVKINDNPQCVPLKICINPA